MSNLQVTKPAQEEKSVSFTPFGAMDSIRLSVGVVKKLCAVPTKSGKLPDDTQCMRFVMLCQAQRLNPFAGDAFLIGYDGKDGPTFSLVTAHVAFLKRAESNEHFDGMESGVIVVNSDGEIKEIQGDFYEAGQEVIGGWARVYHKQRKIPTYRRLRVERFNKGFGEWAKDPAGMICKCAEADALRSTFPTLCGGLYLENEMTKTTIDVEAIARTPSFSGRQAIEAKSVAQIEAPEPDAISEAASATPKPAAPKLTPQQEIEAWMDANKITFDDFRDWLRSTGTLGDADSYGEVAALPGDVCQGLLLSPKQLANCAKIYGKK